MHRLNNNSPVAVNKWLVTIAVMAGTFMEIVDTTVVNVALPHIAGSLASSEDETTWILTAYLVSNAIILPITGWLSALIGRKRFLLLCIALFTLSSMLCGAATSKPASSPSRLMTCAAHSSPSSWMMALMFWWKMFRLPPRRPYQFFMVMEAPLRWWSFTGVIPISFVTP